MGTACRSDRQFLDSSKPEVAPIVFVVGDDMSFPNSMHGLIHCEGWRRKAFPSAREFISAPRSLVPSCLILALHRSHSNDLELQREIARERPEIPIIVICRYADFPTTVQAIKAGAVDFLVNPFADQVLLGAIREGLDRSRAIIEEQVAIQMLRDRYASLSGREQQVMTLVVQGRLNKLIGHELGISEITVKAHRGRVMCKMEASCLANLVNMAATLGLPRSPTRARPTDSKFRQEPAQAREYGAHQIRDGGGHWIGSEDNLAVSLSRSIHA